ncbi:sll1863 family stress response protein [Sideroxydans sp.]
MDIQEAYKQKRAAQLKEWGAQITLLEAKAENVSADLKVKHAEAMQALRVKQRTASEKLQELGSASAEAWEDVKTTADKVWDELKSGMSDAHARFK